MLNKKKALLLFVTAGTILSLTQNPNSVHAIGVRSGGFHSSVHVTPRTTVRSTRSFHISRSTPKSTPKAPSKFKSSKGAMRQAKKYTAKTKTTTPKWKQSMSQTGQRFSQKTFSQAETQKILGEHYPTYTHQSIFSNPWMWLFFMNHHRNVAAEQSDDYQKGYRDGLMSASKEEKTKKEVKQPWKKSKTTYSNDYKEGWQKGYDDYKADAKKEGAKF